MVNQDIDLKLDQTTEHYKMSDLTEDELQYARTFARSIDVTNKVMVLQYGTEAQRKVKRLSESAHLNIPENDLNEIEMLLKRIIRQLNEFEDEVKRTRNITMPSDKALQQFRSQYDAFNSKLGECARRLEILRSALLHHIDRMDRLYQEHLKVVREFDLYLYAGEECLKDSRANRQRELTEKAKTSTLMEDAIKAKDFREDCLLFEKKLGDLSLSRELPLQMMSQLKLIQSTDTVMASNLRRLTMDIFPLYRSRIVLAMGQSSEGAIEPQVFIEANNALRKAVNAVLKEETEKRRMQKEKTTLFRQ